MNLASATAVLPAQDLDRISAFYREKVGLAVTKGIVGLTIGDGANRFYVYPAEAKAPGVFTQAALQVPDVRSAVKELRARGVAFEDYDTETLKTTDGIAPTPDGKEAAWFKDSEGNVLVLVAADGQV
jgi:catechol 2,3-dioxygenase-like lactoylglutathione lyase family enzyme